jgi:hypothetical protein
LTHVTMMDNLLHQLSLMGHTAGVPTVVLEKKLNDRDVLVDAMVRRSNNEELRIVRFAGFGDFFDELLGEMP